MFQLFTSPKSLIRTALPLPGSNLPGSSPGPRYGPNESQTPPWSYAQPASRVLPPPDGPGLAVPLLRTTCMPWVICLPWKLPPQLGLMRRGQLGQRRRRQTIAHAHFLFPLRPLLQQASSSGPRCHHGPQSYQQIFPLIFFCLLCLFSVATVTDYHKPGGTENRHLLFYGS